MIIPGNLFWLLRVDAVVEYGREETSPLPFESATVLRFHALSELIFIVYLLFYGVKARRRNRERKEFHVEGGSKCVKPDYWREGHRDMTMGIKILAKDTGREFHQMRHS